ncbi:MAG: hypothetical protein GXX96_25870 [Planctomycetaceae bacterium]|nr:hypothetical protein [Planctomycetaceae bacterium]
MSSVSQDLGGLLEEVDKLPDATIRRYPDGSLQLEGEEAIQAFERIGGERLRRHDEQLLYEQEDYGKARPLLGGVRYSSLKAYAGARYVIWDWGEHVKRWDRERLCVTTERDIPALEECPIDDLTVSVGFKRRVREAKRQQFGREIAAWCDSVRIRGVFDEGPVAWPRAEIEMFRTLARFRIDSHLSGQNTINWLILRLLDHCTDNPISTICFTKQPFVNATFEEYYGLANDDLIMLHPSDAADDTSDQAQTSFCHRVQSPGVSQKPSHVPSSAEPFPGLTAEHFGVLVTKPCSSDSLLLTIYFERLPNRQQRKSFEKSVHEWASIGMSGGYGAGFHYTAALEYVEESDSARLFCDVGSADLTLALNVLANMLDSWCVEGMAIEALVVGEGGPP